MSEVQVMSGTDPRARKALDHLVDIYNGNDQNFPADYMKLNTPESVVIFYSEKAGGIVLDRLNHKLKKSKKLICLWLCIEKDFRGHGLARRFANLASQFGDEIGSEFIGAYVDAGHQMDLWESLGYKHQGSMNFSVVMTKRPMDDLWSEDDE